jgi:formate dehydrogenase subunit delta
MNIDLLIKMTNEIGEFFTGVEVNDPDAAARDVANHLKRYWDPRMRTQMLKYYEERGGAGLSDLAKNAVALLHAASQAPPAAPGTAATAATAASAPPRAPAKGAGT